MKDVTLKRQTMVDGIQILDVIFVPIRAVEEM